MTEKHKQRISLANKGKVRTKKHKQRMSNLQKGKHYSPKTEFKTGCISLAKDKKFPQCSGKKHHNWKGGKTKDYAGYIYIRKLTHPFVTKTGYIKRSRFVMEQYLGRYLKPTEIIHHINHIKDDDRIENLMLFPNHAKHRLFHHFNPIK